MKEGSGEVADRIGMVHGLCVGEEAGARNLVFFRVKWLQAAMPPVCGGCGCVRLAFFCRIVTVASSCFGCACLCVVIIIGYFGICGCRSHWNGCMNVAWALFWGGSRSTKPCIFPCKVAAGGDERHLVCAAGVAAVVPDAIGSFYVFCNEWLFLWA